MSTSIVSDTDQEILRYEEAVSLADNPPPLEATRIKKTVFNTNTGKNEILLPLEAGGYVKVGELPRDRIRDIKKYHTDLTNMGEQFDMQNFIAAGYSQDEVISAGIVPESQSKTGRTEPLSEGEQLLFIRSGQDLAMPRTETMREKNRYNMYLNDQGELRQIYKALGINEKTARQIAEGIFGNPNSTRDIGLGVLEFSPLGLFYGAEEGYAAYKRGRKSGDVFTTALGALEAGLSVLEAIPITAAGAKGAKKSIPVLRKAIIELGQDADARIAQEGNTLFSNPISPAVDRLLSSLGRVIDTTKTNVRADGGLPIAQEKGDENLRLHTQRIANMRDKNVLYPGAPKNPRTVIKAPENSDLPDVVVGNIEPQDWQNRIEAAMSKEQIEEAATWYKIVFGEFQKQAKGDPEEVARLTDAWFAGQQNSSPGQTLNDVLYVYEQINRGVPKEKLKGKGLPSANKIVIDILTQSEITGGAGQKIADFLDAGYGKNVRSIMANNPDGGSPFVVDVHTARDTGLVDQIYINHLERLGYDVPDNLTIDFGGGGIKGPMYENRALFGHQLTDHLNQQNWLGRSDWEPAEIQAIGWMQLSNMYGGSNTGGDIVDAFTTNTRRISMEVDPGEGSPWAEKFGNDFSNLPIEDRRSINDKVTSEAINLVNKEMGIKLGSNVHGTGGWELFQNPSTVQQAIASKDTAIEAGARLGYLLQQTQVWVNAPKAITKNPQNFSIDIIEDGSETLRDSNKLTELFEAIIEAEPRGLIKGYQPILIDNKPGIRIIVTRDEIAKKAKVARSAKEIIKAPKGSKEKDRLIKTDDIVQYVQDFANNDLEQVLEKVDIYAQVDIMESDLTILENKWGNQKNGEGYKSYFSGQSGKDASTDSAVSGVLDTDGAQLEQLFGDLISEAKKRQQ